MEIGRRVLFLAVVGCVLGRGVAQEKPQRLKVVVLGASVSAGFVDPTSKRADGSVNRTYRLDEALKLAWPGEVARLYNLANMAMFTRPAEIGRQQIDACRTLAPDLVLAVDYPFWFGYGRFPRGEEGKVERGRVALQEQGLALLAELRCPVLVGDYPDMRGSSSHMLPRAMIPNAATQMELNKRLRAWAGKRKNVCVLPLAAFVADAVGKEQSFPYGGKRLVLPRNHLLQADRLHASRLGMLVMVLQLQTALPAVLPERHPLLRTEVTLQGLVRAAGLEWDVEDYVRPVKRAPK